MNRAERRRHDRSVSSGGRHRPMPSFAPTLLEWVIFSDPGCSSEEHRDMVMALMFGRSGEEGCASDLVLDGDRVQWSCGCTFWIDPVEM